MSALDKIFSALSDETRRAILEQLMTGETALSDIAQPFEMSQTAVSKHVKVLKEAGLVEINKRGRTRYCRIAAKPMKEAVEWLQDYRGFWESGLSSLAQYIEDNP